MRQQAIGWELTTFLVVGVCLALATILDSEALLGVSLLAVAITTPIVVASFLVRLTVGIVRELRP